MDIHMSPRQKQIICFALNFLQANIDDVHDMLEEAPSEIVGSDLGYDEVEDLVIMYGEKK
jgi:hypothetical protein